jgi:N-acylneuraminate cytidylyltransferase
LKPIAIIPARGGSKRIPKKNIRLLAGKPAIAYPIELALESGLFGRVVVTTDDEEIASIAREFGAEVPFTRSVELSDDFAITIEVIADALQKLEIADIGFACCIYPVTPLLTKDRLNQAYEILKTNLWDYVFPACEYTTPIERAFRKNYSGQVNFLDPNFVSTRTQDIEKSYYDAGQFYFGKIAAWKHMRPILSGKSTFIELTKNETLDIDDIEDWKLVESFVQFRL